MRSTLTALAAALVSGVIFGIGLAIAQMTDPEKVKNFLDIAAISSGGWDPSLAFVMGGAAVVAFFGLRLNKVMQKPIAEPVFHVATKTRLDRQLVVGSALFGIGWGISGLCPGPAVADLGIVPQSVAIFVMAMLAGSWLTGEIAGWSKRIVAPAADAVAK